MSPQPGDVSNLSHAEVLGTHIQPESQTSGFQEYPKHITLGEEVLVVKDELEEKAARAKHELVEVEAKLAGEQPAPTQPTPAQPGSESGADLTGPQLVPPQPQSAPAQPQGETSQPQGSAQPEQNTREDSSQGTGQPNS